MSGSVGRWIGGLFLNSEKRIEGKLHVLKTMIGGFCSDDNPLKIQVDDVEDR